LHIAKSYPYEAPIRSFLYRDGGEHPIVPDPGDPAHWVGQGRIPVIAYGANRSATALSRKYAGWPEGTEIPVINGWLDDYDVTYSSHISRYGSIPAKLEPVAGVRVNVGVIFLTPDQLASMHETEHPRNYRFDWLAHGHVALDGGGTLDRVAAYGGIRPSLHDRDRPVPLAAIEAQGRAAQARNQIGALGLARDLLTAHESLDHFILENIRCRFTRWQRTDRLTAMWRHTLA
jgi:hypothetical protein